MIDIKQLNKVRYEKVFLEYFCNLILSGVGRSVYEKKDMEELLPFIKELMEDD